MLRIDAVTHVAAMENAHALRYRAISEFPRSAVSRLYARIGADYAVTVHVARTIVEPTGFGFRNSLPKSSGYLLWRVALAGGITFLGAKDLNLEIAGPFLTGPESRPTVRADLESRPSIFGEIAHRLPSMRFSISTASLGSMYFSNSRARSISPAEISFTAAWYASSGERRATTSA